MKTFLLVLVAVTAIAVAAAPTASAGDCRGGYYVGAGYHGGHCGPYPAYGYAYPRYHYAPVVYPAYYPAYPVYRPYYRPRVSFGISFGSWGRFGGHRHRCW
jgi:hypothetical protein